MREREETEEGGKENSILLKMAFELLRGPSPRHGRKNERKTRREISTLVYIVLSCASRLYTYPFCFPLVTMFTTHKVLNEMDRNRIDAFE